MNKILQFRINYDCNNDSDFKVELDVYRIECGPVWNVKCLN